MNAPLEPSSSVHTRDDVAAAARYFGSFVEDYHLAFEGKGRGVLQGAINRLFRHKTFHLRTEIVKSLLEQHGVAGKRVLDLGCGTGEVALVAARLGARVVGIDIVRQMVEVARREAAKAGLAEVTEFRVGDITAPVEAQVDVTLLIGVIEYYENLRAVLEPSAAATREMIVIADTRGPWWRRMLRRLLAKLKRFHLYYRSPDDVVRVLARLGFREVRRIGGHSFTIMTFKPA